MKRRATPGRRQNEGGFALLLVFLLAGAIALMLYRQMPREAFESERDKEQLLIDHGEQYKRAIYLYYIGNNRTWPAKIEDLENTNNHRYLRRRYIDPYTGKDEWRLIHTNGAFLTDSLVTPPPAQGAPGSPGSATAGVGGASSPTSTLTSALTSSISTVDPNAPPEVNAQVQRRPSDRTVQNSNFQNQAGNVPTQGTDPGYQPFNPAALPPISLYPNGYNAPPVNVAGTNVPGAQPGNPNGLNQPGQPGFNQPGSNQPGFVQPGFNQPGGNQPGAIQPGVFQPIQPGGFTIPGTNSPVTTPGVSPPTFNPVNSNQGFNQPAPVNQIGFNQLGLNQSGTPNQPNVPGFNAPGVPGAPGAAPSNPALNLINNLLTTPRQAPTGIGAQPTTGGGLAGVASTYKGKAIKSYLDRTKYQEWEFVFQVNTLTTLQAPQAAGPNGQAPGGGPGGTAGAPGAPGAPGGIVPGNTAPGGASPFFTSPGGASPGGTNPGGPSFGTPSPVFGTN